MKKVVLNIVIYLFLPTILPILFIQDKSSNKYTYLVFVSYILLMIYYIITNKKTIYKDFKNINKINIKKTLIIFTIGLLFMILSNYIINYLIIPNGISNNESITRELLINNKIIYIILLSTVIPFLEEQIFRYNFKKIIENEYLYLIITSIIFSSLHIISSSKIVELLYIIPYFILGYTLGLIYLKTNNILYNTLAHMLNNIIAIIIVLI